MLSNPAEGNRKVFIELGRAFLHFRAYRAAILFFEKIKITEQRDIAEFMSSIGLCLFHLGEIKALNYLKKAAISCPNQFKVNRAICSILIQSQVPSAKLWVFICGKTHPYEKKSNLQIGKYLIDNHKWSEARHILQEIIQRDSDETALSMLLTVLVKENSLCELESLAEVTISQNLGAIFYNNLIVSLSELNSQKFDLLRENVLLKKFDEARIYYNIGLFYYNFEKFSIAYKYFRMAGSLIRAILKHLIKLLFVKAVFIGQKKLIIYQVGL